MPGAMDLWARMAQDDVIVILTARSSVHRASTEAFLLGQGLRFNLLIMDLPHGERLLFNDRKPDGCPTAHAFNLNRDEGFSVEAAETIRGGR